MKNTPYSKFFFLFLLWMLPAMYCNGQTPGQLAEQAAAAYNRKAYPEAIAGYQKIIAMGFESAPLYYNLGNAYFRSNELAPAVLYYEKALKIDPNNDDIRHNIETVNRKLVDKVEFVPELFYKRWWKQLVNLFDVNTYAIVSLALLVIALLLAGVYIAVPRYTVRKASFWTGVFFLALFALSMLAGSQRRHYMTSQHEAIVFTPVVNVKSSPDENSKDLFVLHEGTKAVLLDVVGSWQEIRISNGNVGWLKTSDLRNI